MNDEIRMSDLEKKIDRILFYFENDPSTGRVGIAHSIDKMDDRLKKLEDGRKVMRGIATFFGAIGSTIAWLIYVLINTNGK